jgi:hypothetical protein
MYNVTTPLRKALPGTIRSEKIRLYLRFHAGKKTSYTVAFL